MTTINVGDIIGRLEEAIEETKAGKILSIVLVCQRVNGPPSCSAIFAHRSGQAQMVNTLYLAAMDMQVNILLDRKLEERALVPVYVGDEQH